MLKTAIVGVSGYTGLELVKLLINHPKFEINYLANTTGNININEIHPSLKNILNFNVDKMNIDEIKKNDIVFLSLPHMQSQKIVKHLHTPKNKDIIIIDLSADYRLTSNIYEKHYCEHLDKSNLKNAVYGLSDIVKNNLKDAKLVANPGCYPIATLLGLLPFCKYFEDNCDIFIDAKSAISGAGKEPTTLKTFMNIDSNCFSYNTFTHRHSPEIQFYMHKFGKYAKNIQSPNIHFSPHILPMKRGMIISAYVKLAKNINAYEMLNKFYSNKKFVRVSKNNVAINNVAGTNFCDIYAKCENNILFVSSVIDNLLKGASSSAIVNANLACGFDEDLGINNIAYMP
jgi:N-acetyl-gamma-glutamyl-phosphate reductase